MFEALEKVKYWYLPFSRDCGRHYVTRIYLDLGRVIISLFDEIQEREEDEECLIFIV
jgi:hypothetical protein